MPPPNAPCPPCQVIIWDNAAQGMLSGATTLAEARLHGAKVMSDEWAHRWYELVEGHCRAMQAMLDELTGVRDGDRVAPSS